MKKLKSGITVDAAKYYRLLEWKDLYASAFQAWARENHASFSINSYSLKEYNDLLKYAKL